ncbi:succinate dehydrogenase, hydrophobic membrane anchor protein [Roseovarius sp. SCSIO 43702]|uniref:succinate dehydrogenase, hydrophobic membrane anchor protein n=1 Tax=Roseovarius sp. SCSIO 43702 TaxID=2823043 RepID=UPI001C738FDC|nr:succinate dehydrogenase, hydrophobic membrane anchor protein [Roseovarius sp. SCSIO 43702]QYX56667.1 succinate dehydrogenase, hydrophobic membrane anchor protein [Roseovarius sp. SCSIO 43702]
MRYLTARKRAEGKGASGTGTEDHWHMTVSAVGLALIVPVFVVIFGRALGGDREEVLATFAHPAIAILTALVIFAGMQHFRRGAQTMIDDYSRGTTRKILIISVAVLSYGLTASGLFALAKIAL